MPRWIGRLLYGGRPDRLDWWQKGTIWAVLVVIVVGGGSIGESGYIEEPGGSQEPDTIAPIRQDPPPPSEWSFPSIAPPAWPDMGGGDALADTGGAGSSGGARPPSQRPGSPLRPAVQANFGSHSGWTDQTQLVPRSGRE